MGRAAVPPTNGAAAPYGAVQGTRGWVWWRNGWFAYLCRQKEMHQKKRETWCVTLSDRHLVATHNNQPIVGGSNSGDV